MEGLSSVALYGQFMTSRVLSMVIYCFSCFFIQEIVETHFFGISVIYSFDLFVIIVFNETPVLALWQLIIFL